MCSTSCFKSAQSNAAIQVMRPVCVDREDPHRVVDYRGGSLMAAGSRDRAVHLFYVGSETKGLTVMKGHVGSIRSVLLCEDRDLVITASSDATIR